MRSKYISRVLKPTVAVFYLLVFLEAFYMVSVFGLVMGAVYAPVERLLDRHPATSWLLSFYLPHFYRPSWGPLTVSTYSGLGILIWFAGLWIFFYSALQIYGTKLAGGAAITGGFYRWIRHPQYLAFMIVPLPFLLIWPRYLLLGMYVFLVLFYIALAFKEERECLVRYGETYREFRDATAMFLPGIRVERLLEAGSRRLPARRMVRLTCVMVLAVCLIAGVLFAAASFSRAWTRRIPQLRDASSLWVPLLYADHENLAATRDLLARDAPVRKALERLRRQGARSFYVLVIPWGEQHFFIDYLGCLQPPHPWNGHPGEDYWASRDLPAVSRKAFRSVVFFASHTRLPEGGSLLYRILLHAGTWRPAYMAGVDLDAGRVVSRVLLKEQASQACSALRVPLL